MGFKTLKYHALVNALENKSLFARKILFFTPLFVYIFKYFVGHSCCNNFLTKLTIYLARQLSFYQSIQPVNKLMPLFPFYSFQIRAQQQRGIGPRYAGRGPLPRRQRPGLPTTPEASTAGREVFAQLHGLALLHLTDPGGRGGLCLLGKQENISSPPHIPDKDPAREAGGRQRRRRRQG